MAQQLIQIVTADNVTDDVLADAARLFTENYGVWDKNSRIPGKPVKLSVRRLREQYLPIGNGGECSYISVTVDGNLAGNAFVCRWKSDTGNVCWVTQLVVHKDYRERGLARGLLAALRKDGDGVYGIMSSHPAAILAAASAFGSACPRSPHSKFEYCLADRKPGAACIEKLSLDFIGKNTTAIIQASPIPYIKDAALRGTVFDASDSAGLVAGADTRFFVDHAEPMAALEAIRRDWSWPLGDLPDGHEFLIVLPAKQRRSKSLLSRGSGPENQLV